MKNEKLELIKIIEYLEENSRAKLAKYPEMDSFVRTFELRHPGTAFYSTLEQIAGIIYSWKNDGIASGITREKFERASMQLAKIQREYDEFTFCEDDKGLESITKELDAFVKPLEKLDKISGMLTARYVRQINERLTDSEKFRVGEQIKFLIGLRDDIKNDIDSKSPIIPAGQEPATEIIHREVVTEQVVIKKSKVLKVVIEDDVKGKLYDQLSAELNLTDIFLCRREDQGPGDTFDIVITKDKSLVKERQIHFQPIEYKKMKDLLERIVSPGTQRAKFVQAVKPNAWYKDQIGKEFFVTIDDLDRPLALCTDQKNVWIIDSRLLKDKYVDVHVVTKIKKIESKQVPKGTIPKWE